MLNVDRLVFSTAGSFSLACRFRRFVGMEWRADGVAWRWCMPFDESCKALDSIIVLRHQMDIGNEKDVQPQAQSSVAIVSIPS